MNVDVITGIVIPIEVEIINYIVHGKIKNCEDIKSTGNGDLTAKSANL